MLEGKQFFWNYLSLGLGQTGSYISQFLLMIIIARVLQPAGYGIVSLFLMISSIVSMLLIDWPNCSIIRYGKEEFIETGKISEIFWARFSILLLTFIIAFFSFLLFKNFIDDFIGIKNASIFLLGYICFSSFILFISNIFQTTGNIKLFSFMNFIPKFFLLVIISIVIFNFQQITVTDTILLYVFTQFVVAIVGIVIINKNWIFPIIISKEKILLILFFSWPLIFNALSGILVDNVSTILIKTYLTVSDVGIYSVAYTIMTLLSMIILSFSYLFSPIVATIKTQQKTQILIEFINDIIPQGVFFWSIFVSLSAIICSFIIPICFGQSYTQAITPLLILLLGLSFMSITALHSSIMVMYDLVKQLMVITILISILNLILSLLLIPRFGLVGAAIATSFSYVIMNILYIPYIYPNFLINFSNISIKNSYNFIIKYNFPIFLVLPICLFVNNSIIKIILSLLLIVFSLIIAKKMNLFKKNMIKNIEYIDMPNPIKKIIKEIYCHLL